MSDADDIAQAAEAAGYKPVNCHVRPMGADDMGFVCNTWVRCLEETPLADTEMRPVIYKMIKRVLERPETCCTLACDALDKTTIWGFAVLEPDVLHIVYVRRSLRGFGLATMLLDGFKGDKCSMKFWKRLGYCPMRLWTTKGGNEVVEKLANK